MKHFTKKAMIKSASTFIIAMTFSVYLSGQTANVQHELYGEQAKQIIPEAQFILQGLNNDLPSYVKFDESKQIQFSEFVTWIKQQFNLSSDIDFLLKKSEPDELGFIHNRYIQTFKGIPIDRAEYIVQVKNGNVVSISGEAQRIMSLPAVVSLSEQTAMDKALSYVNAKSYRWQNEYWEKDIKEKKNDPTATYYPKGSLIITRYGTQPSGKSNGELRLAYVFDIYASSPHSEQRIFVDAESGSILYSLPLASNCEPPVNFTSVFDGTQSVQTDKYTSTLYRLNDNCVAASVWIRDWNSTTSTGFPIEIDNTTNTWTTQDERFGATVLWETKQSYAYFLNVFGRNSYDNANGDVTGYVNAVFSSSSGDYTDNASMSFSGGQMLVGLGSSGTLANSWCPLDVIGHEYTHAVTGSSSQLVYSNESGALNESFSDIFGEMIENNVAGTNDWLIGDDRTSGAIRSMSNPNSFNDPDTYLGTNWNSGSSDNGGVHTNSGVQNFWFYLLTVGGSGTNDNGNAYSVSGLGITDASAIAFRNNTVKLGMNSNYAAARTGAIESAVDLFGTCSNAVKQVTNAWYAVGVGNPYVNAVANSPLKPGGYNISCNGGTDGAINLTLSGTSPYTIVWAHGPTSQNLTNLSAGTYSVTVTDATGCSVSTSITLTQPTLCIVSASVTSNYNGYGVSCAGGSDGIATAIASGGAPPYSYLWDANAGNQTTAVASNLPAGSYSVIVTDANGCGGSASVTLTEPPPLTIDAGPNQTVYYGYPPAACATISWSGQGGGVPPYNISWSDGGSQSHGVCPAVTTTYTVTITDANGCVGTDEVKICAIDVRCGKNLDKVEICHYTPSISNNKFQTLCVALEAVAKHLAHGDKLAACGTDPNCYDFKSSIADNGIEGLITSDMNLDAYPNPFSNSATIEFSSTSSGKVTLQLYDFSGRMVKELYNAEVEMENYYEVELDGNDLNAGMYYCMLRQSDGQTKGIKLIVNK
jgi:Zn-dependent metalloprotease